MIAAHRILESDASAPKGYSMRRHGARVKPGGNSFRQVVPRGSLTGGFTSRARNFPNTRSPPRSRATVLIFFIFLRPRLRRENAICSSQHCPKIAIHRAYGPTLPHYARSQSRGSHVSKVLCPPTYEIRGLLKRKPCAEANLVITWWHATK